MYERYREIEFQTASPEGLVVKMYDGAIRFARRAIECNRSGRIAERGQALSRALAVVSELRSCLDFDQGGEVARNLESLYNYISDRLLEANLRGRSEPIEESVQILEMLREAWREVAASAGNPAAKVAR